VRSASGSKEEGTLACHAAQPADSASSALAIKS
jgi:hypothetical protein